MRNQFNLEIAIEEGITCEYGNGFITCKCEGKELKRKLVVPGTDIKVEGEKIVFQCEKANKKNIAKIKATVSHIKNLFKGLKEGFVYELEVCNVHFPMNVKVEGSNLIISNFLGEKVNRTSKILEGVKVEVKGNKIIVTGEDKEKTGQTAANIEKASKVPKKDRRVFQDGIFLTLKAGGAI